MDWTVLLIDDEQLIRELFTFRLEQLGYRVLTAVDGRDGVIMATRERPDAILLDLSMPRMDGWEAIERLRSQPETREIPIAAFTSECLDESGSERLRGLGFDALLPKNAPLPELLDQIGRLIERNG